MNIRLSLPKITFGVKAGLAILILVVVEAGSLSCLPFVKNTKNVASSEGWYSVCDLVKKFKPNECKDVTVRGTLHSFSKEGFQLQGEDCERRRANIVALYFDQIYLSSPEIQGLLNKLRSFDKPNEFKTVEVEVIGQVNDNYYRERDAPDHKLVITHINLLSDIATNYLKEELCPVHNLVMKTALISFYSTDYTVIRQSKNYDDEYQKAKELVFPNANMQVRIIERQRRAECGYSPFRDDVEISYCQMCRDQERDWVSHHASGNVSFD